jgi:2-amino-4-hydroxy-6-hydroxymethyldihydropteridine diphosphokinase
MRPSTTELYPAIEPRREDVFIGLGANIGDARGALDAAFAALASLPLTELVAASSIYRSAPIESSGPDYLNAVIKLRSALDPFELLEHLQHIEVAHGRRRPYRNAPRTLDLDLLLYGDRQIESCDLTVPHPRMHQRAFVLAPLAEVDAQLRIPRHGAVTDLLHRVADQRIDRLRT